MAVDSGKGSTPLSSMRKKLCPHVCNNQEESIPLKPEIKSVESKWRCKILEFLEPSAFLMGFTILAFTQMNQEYMLFLRLKDVDLNATSMAEITSDAAYMATKLYLFRNIPPIVMILFVCSYTDHVGRKFGLLLPVVGALFNISMYILVDILDGPMELLYAGNLIAGLAGGHLAFIGMVLVYLSDTLPKEKLGVRFTLMQCMYFASSAISGAVIGYILQYVGFRYAFFLVATFYIIIILHVACIMPESLPLKERESFKISRALSTALTGFRVIFKREPAEMFQKTLISTFFAFTTITLVKMGNFSVQAAYAQGPPFFLNPSQFGAMLVIACIGNVFCCLIGVRVLMIYFSDETVAIICNSVQLIGFIYEGIATNALGLYICEYIFTLLKHFIIIINGSILMCHSIEIVIVI